MFLKFLGLIDLFMALCLVLATMDLPIAKFYIIATLAHATKATIYIRDILSLIDLLIVLYTIIMPFWGNTTLTVIVVIFLMLKGVYSFA